MDSTFNQESVWSETEKFYGERIFKALDYLEFKVRNVNAVEACRSIEKIISEQNKFRLFQKYFPDEWKNSQTSLFKTGFFLNYTERTAEFLELVNKHLFPILDGWDEEPEADFENFSIYSLNIDFCCEFIEYENLRVSYLTALLFFGNDDELWEFFTNNYRLKKEDFPEINRYSFDKIWELERTGKIGLYLNIFEVVDHSTGNPWFDTTNCHNNDCFSWDETTVEFLAQSYRETDNIIEKIALLDELMTANPKETLFEMISLWNDGINDFKS